MFKKYPDLIFQALLCILSLLNVRRRYYFGTQFKISCVHFVFKRTTFSLQLLATTNDSCGENLHLYRKSQFSGKIKISRDIVFADTGFAGHKIKNLVSNEKVKDETISEEEAGGCILKEQFFKRA